jgi:DtxR family Mn-dependent transcriptional regulator
MRLDCAALVKPTLSPTVEDYLRVIYSLQREGVPAIAARLGDRLRVSPPTVWATLRRMGRDGLLVPNRHHIQLSEAGSEAAESIIRRHMLVERFLIDILQMGWAEVHQEAHRLEHAISPAIERQMCALLGNPRTCPHGNPIPGMPQTAVETRSLAAAHEGERLIVNNIVESAEEDDELMHYLERSGLIPGTPLTVEELSPGGETIRVSVGPLGRQAAVSRRVALTLQVREEGVEDEANQEGELRPGN